MNNKKIGKIFNLYRGIMVALVTSGPSTSIELEIKLTLVRLGLRRRGGRIVSSEVNGLECPLDFSLILLSNLKLKSHQK